LAATVFALAGPEPLISFAGVLSVGYRPTAEVIFPALFMSGSIWDTGLISNIKVSAARSIILGRDNDAAPSNFDGNACFNSDITFTFLAAYIISTELLFSHCIIGNMSRNVLNIESGRAFNVPLPQQ
jgi:hypothetical protein